MKNILMCYILICFFATIHIYAQKTEAVLTLKDSTQLKGLAKINIAGKVKYRKTKKDKPVLYDFAQLISVKLYEGFGNSTYVKKKVKNSTSPVFKILEVIEEGKVNLYKKVHEGNSYMPSTSAGGNFGGVGFGGGFGPRYSISNYYIQKEGEEEVTHLGSTSIFSKNFKKAAAAYFADCPILVEKIQKRKYKKRDINAIVEFYNLDCK